ncbi:substrate-binding domain-containing protein [Sharpea porci]|nr:substrate-binding domain-containing protein [Sharpea porci]
MSNKVIGMIVPTTDNSFFSSLTHYVELILDKNSYKLFVCDSNNNSEREKEYLKLLSTCCDGIIDVSGLSEFNENLIPNDFPIVFVDRKPSSSKSIPWIGNDDEKAMYEATSYILGKNCKNILLLPGFIAEYQESPRVMGYKKALMDNGIVFDDSYVLNRKGLHSSEVETQDLVMKALSENKDVDAIITSSDRAAFSAMNAIGKLGYYAPEDIKLISFDNSPYSTLSSPSITSIDRNPKAIAAKAVEVLLDRMNGKEVNITNMIEVSLVIRDSTR